MGRQSLSLIATLFCLWDKNVGPGGSLLMPFLWNSRLQHLWREQLSSRLPSPTAVVASELAFVSS